MSKELLAEFIEDAREHLQAAGGYLLALEKAPDRADELHGLLRHVHSIKGNAGFLDLRSLYILLHKAENILQTAREQACANCPRELLDALFQVLDTVEVMLGNLEKDGTDRAEGLDHLLASLDAFEAALADPKPDDRPSPTPVTVETETPPPWPMERVRAELAVLMALLSTNANGSDAETCRIEDALDSLQAPLRPLGRNPLAALAIARDYLQLLQDDSRPLAGPARMLLHGLLANLDAWIEADAPPPVDPESGFAVLKPSLDEINPLDHRLGDRVEHLVEQGAKSLAFDLRDYQTLGSSQIDSLVAAAKRAGRGIPVGVILDPDAQHGLLRVFRLMGLEKLFEIVRNEDEARKRLQKGSPKPRYEQI